MEVIDDNKPIPGKDLFDKLQRKTMMSSAKVEFVRYERTIEIYENQRMWIGSGFSKQGLLPGERGPYSTKDGSLSWKTMPDAALSLLRGDFTTVSTGPLGSPRRNNGKSITSKQRIRRGWSFHEEDGDFDGSDKENERKEDEYECSTEENGDSSAADSSAAADIDYCGFVPCIGPEDGPVDQDGWQVCALMN